MRAAIWPVALPLAGLAVLCAAGAARSASLGPQAQRRLQELVGRRGAGAAPRCAADCRAEGVLAGLDSESRILRSGPPDLDFIRGLAADVPSPEVRRLDDGRLEIRVRRIGRRTGREIVAVLSGGRACARGGGGRAGGAILDLRGCVGGHLGSALEIASAFAPAGALLVEVVGRDGIRRFQSPTGGALRGLPLEVRVDRRTASSAELLAWLLRFYGGARVVGERTAGKGSVQEVYRLDAERRLLLTTGYLRLPDGSRLQGRGVVPDRPGEAASRQEAPR